MQTTPLHSPSPEPCMFSDVQRLLIYVWTPVIFYKPVQGCKVRTTLQYIRHQMETFKFPDVARHRQPKLSRTMRRHLLPIPAPVMFVYFFVWRMSMLSSACCSPCTQYGCLLLPLPFICYGQQGSRCHFCLVGLVGSVLAMVLNGRRLSRISSGQGYLPFLT